jgi:hypothetical protein
LSQISPFIIFCVAATGCGGDPAQSTTPTAARSMHSLELDRIMKDEVNQPYSALVFGVFHGDNGIDYSAITIPAEALRAGIAKARDIADPPAATNEGRSVFFTYLDSLAHDAGRLQGAIVQRDQPSMEAALNRLGKTCNNCHHFFRLEIRDAPEN